MIIPGGKISIAPVGTDLSDTEAWREIGTIDHFEIDLTLEAKEPVIKWPIPAARTFSMEFPHGGLTWFGYRALAGRKGPSKAEYHRRRR